MLASQNTFTVYAGESPPEGVFDFACPLLSLPLVLNTAAATIPKAVPYIYDPVGTCLKSGGRFSCGMILIMPGGLVSCGPEAPLIKVIGLVPFLLHYLAKFSTWLR